jgi:hypothetical protein
MVKAMRLILSHHDVSKGTRRLGRSLLGASFMLAALVAAPGVGHAGFFEELFGGGDAAASRQAAPPPRARARWAYPAKAFARRHRRRESGEVRFAPAADDGSGGTRPTRVALCYAQTPAKSDPETAILHDETLRPGDSLMTTEGVRVFHGDGACPHKAGDFVSLNESRNLSHAKRGDLIAIERATKAPHGRDLAHPVDADRAPAQKP